MDPKKYVLNNGKSYVMGKLVLGQIQDLTETISGMSFPAGMDLSVENLILQLGDKVGRALAIVLTEEGRPLHGKDLDSLSLELRYAVDDDMLIRIVRDFFELNPRSSLLDLLNLKLWEVLMRIAGGQEPESTGLSCDLQTETFSGET